MNTRLAAYNPQEALDIRTVNNNLPSYTAAELTAIRSRAEAERKEAQRTLYATTNRDSRQWKTAEIYHLGDVILAVKAEQEKRAQEAKTALPSSLFHFHPGKNIFTAEVSSLQGAGYQVSNAFRIRSTKTGDCIVFRHIDTVKDNDGDLQYWLFDSSNHSVFGAPQMSVKIFND